MDTAIKPGDRVLARTAFDALVERRAVTGPIKGDNFLVIRVCTEEEWDASRSAAREPQSTPWPAEDILPIQSGKAGDLASPGAE